jgi:hypothetical protein
MLDQTAAHFETRLAERGARTHLSPGTSYCKEIGGNIHVADPHDQEPIGR